MDLLYVLVGLGLLIVAGNSLVKGAVALAIRLGIPTLIVGLTVVAFGTSAPELVVSIQAASQGQAGIALGNVVGSNIANILLVLGVPALIAAIKCSQVDCARSYWIMLATAVLFAALCFTGPLTWKHGLVLLAGLGLATWDNIRQARASADPSADKPTVQMAGWMIATYILAGLIGLAIGAQLLVEGAVNIARAIGVSETVIGLTLVAVGTSLPELVTSIIAALRHRPEVAIGNVIGSNTLNFLAIIGITSLIAPLDVPAQLLRLDIWVMLAVSLLLMPFAIWKLDIGRWAGFGLVALYGVYSYFLVLA